MKYLFFFLFVVSFISCRHEPQPQLVLQITAEEVLHAVKASQSLELVIDPQYSVESEGFPDSIEVEGVRLFVLNADSTASSLKLSFYQIRDTIDQDIIADILIEKHRAWRREQIELVDSYLQVPPPEVRRQNELIVYLEGGLSKDEQYPIIHVIDSLLLE